jgi:hypothetical protein
MGKVRLAAIAAMGLVSALAGASACGGSDSSDVTDGKGDGGGGSETGTSGGEGGTGSYTLDDVCDKVAPKICAMRKPCCDKSHGYDEAGCLAEAKADCAKDVADARAGRATFRPELVDPCIDKYTALFASCDFSYDLYFRALKVIKECRVFEGQLAEGAACERDAQCKPAAGANEIATCDKDGTKQCVKTTLLAETAPCELGEGIRATCDQGLYCDVNFASQPFKGTCKKTTPLGSKCDAAKKPISLECGLGNQCDKASSVCAVGKAPGAACETDLECSSLKCPAGADGGADAGKTCGPAPTLMKPEECKGP